MKKRNQRIYAAAGVPFLLAYGIPALLVACVVSGVWVLAALIIKTVKKRKQKAKEIEE